jgi:hypothetical protein
MTLVLDAGAFIALERGDVTVAALALLVNDGDELLTSDLEDFRGLCQAANVSRGLLHVERPGGLCQT